MILLKTSIFLIGLATPSSISTSVTVVPSMHECKSYLQHEYNRVKDMKDTKIVFEGNKLSFERVVLGHTMSSGVECLEIK